MRKRIELAGAILIVSALFVGADLSPAIAARAAEATSGAFKAKVLKPGEKVTFLELGSVGCKPCEAMKPVMQAVRDRYGKQVEVTFHDVREDRTIASKWGIRLIPTQIFLDPTGKEVLRHEGFLALEKIEAVLRQMGVR